MKKKHALKTKLATQRNPDLPQEKRNCKIAEPKQIENGFFSVIYVSYVRRKLAVLKTI